MKFKDFVEKRTDEMTVRINADGINNLTAKPIKKKYNGRKMVRGLDVRILGQYFAQNKDGSWEEIPKNLVEGDEEEKAI